MKRVMLTVAVALLIPSILYGIDNPPTVGVYFEHGYMTANPTPWVPFRAMLYIVQSDPDTIYSVMGVEYMLEQWQGMTQVPPFTKLQIFVDTEHWPWQYSIDYGGPESPTDGHSISYFPALNPLPYGYSHLCTYTFILMEDCVDARDLEIRVVANPSSGYLRGTYYPDGDKFPIIGLTSLICPELFATEEESWGAIKSMMYR
jgi:hypothetical protein